METGCERRGYGTHTQYREIFRDDLLESDPNRCFTVASISASIQEWLPPLSLRQSR